MSVTVTCVDDNPVAVDDAATVAEDSGATTIDVLANDTDVDGGPKSIESVTQPTNGTVVVDRTRGAEPHLRARSRLLQRRHAHRRLHLHPHGGSGATVAVTVTCVDDAPVAVDDTATVAEDDSPTTIDVLANDTDVDGGPKMVESVTQPTNGTVVITGGGRADLCSQPRLLQQPAGTRPTTSPTPSTAARRRHRAVAVTCSDDAPVAVNDSATVAEDWRASPVDVLANDTDVDGGPKSVQSITQPANGSAAITGGGTGVSYTPNANFCGGPDAFTYTLNGASTASVSMTVTCAPDAPVLNTGGGGPLLYTENDPATPVAPALTLTDVDAGGSITGATVQITANYAGAQDVLALGGTHPGITASQAGDTLTLSGTASPAAYQAALRDVTYRNSSDSRPRCSGRSRSPPPTTQLCPAPTPRTSSSRPPTTRRRPSTTRPRWVRTRA